ncbi:MAG: GIY-YIG nuclease family protein [Candidatus Neomarinimicrobiota bacterium]
MYFTYVLYSRSFDRLYIGQTDDLRYRVEKHNREEVTATKAYVPWELIYYEEFSSRSEAMRREGELKSHQGRDFIRRNLLNG